MDLETYDRTVYGAKGSQRSNFIRTDTPFDAGYQIWHDKTSCGIESFYGSTAPTHAVRAAVSLSLICALLSSHRSIGFWH